MEALVSLQETVRQTDVRAMTLRSHTTTSATLMPMASAGGIPPLVSRLFSSLILPRQPRGTIARPLVYFAGGFRISTSDEAQL